MFQDSDRILFLVKVFKMEEHARDFMNGAMFANRLSYFKGIDGSDIRKDDDEGALMLPREGAIVKLTTTNQKTGEVSSIVIRESELAGPLIVRPGWTNYINLFCMYAGHRGDLENIANGAGEGCDKRLTIPEGVLEGFGEHAVIIVNVPEFFKRVAVSAKRKGYGIKGRLVVYYDAEVGAPSTLSYEDTVFAKRNKYAREREYRIVINTSTTGRDAIALSLGRIDDIARYVGNPSEIAGGRLRAEFAGCE